MYNKNKINQDISNDPIEDSYSSEIAPKQTFFIQDKILEARATVTQIHTLEKQTINPTLRNPCLQPMMPVFDPSVNYVCEAMKWQSYFQIAFNANQNLETLTRNLQDKRIQTIKWTPKRFSKKKKRRVASQIQRRFRCPYQNCFKSYGSDVSLNLHIKIKHHGGNKTDREKLAQQICQAQFSGLPLPAVDIIFPPGFLQKYRCQYVSKTKDVKNEVSA